MAEDHTKYAGLLTTFSDYLWVGVVSSSGKMLFQTPDGKMSDEEAGELAQTWLNKQSAFHLEGNRFAVLSWEDYQFAARNVTGHGAVVGSKLRDGNLMVAHLPKDSKMAPTIGAITLNRWAWEQP